MFIIPFQTLCYILHICTGKSGIGALLEQDGAICRFRAPGEPHNIALSASTTWQQLMMPDI